MKSFLVAWAVAVALAGVAHAQAVKNGQVSGTLVSASATAPSGGTQADLLTTPAGGAFLLTQICVVGSPGSNNEDQASVEGSTIGRIAQDYRDDGMGYCTRYEPGLAIPPGETLRCVQGGASGSPVACTITGVQSKK